jgi:hypothetical protein
MDITAVYINTYKYDFPFAKICIASIRYWYPDIPIFLIKDMGAGPFDTSVIESKLNVGVLDTAGKSFGWGFGKFEPLFKEGKESFLFMDADTAMVGPVLDQMKAIVGDFVVDKEVTTLEKIISLYYDPEKIRNLFSDFIFPGYCFNTGQWIGTSGILKRSDFETLVSWDPKPSLKFPEVFKQADQGVFNFIIHRKELERQLTVVKTQIMVWPEKGAADFIDLSALKNKSQKFPFIIHWAGMKENRLKDFPRADILTFYRDYYYLLVGESFRKYDNLSVLLNRWQHRAKLFRKSFHENIVGRR